MNVRVILGYKMWQAVLCMNSFHTLSHTPKPPSLWGIHGDMESFLVQPNDAIVFNHLIK